MSLGARCCIALPIFSVIRQRLAVPRPARSQVLVLVGARWRPDTLWTVPYDLLVLLPYTSVYSLDSAFATGTTSSHHKMVSSWLQGMPAALQEIVAKATLSMPRFGAIEGVACQQPCILVRFSGHESGFEAWEDAS